VIAYLRLHAGHLFDPAVVETFLAMVDGERERRDLQSGWSQRMVA
jgi:response regulator RpfG family c-di-GMP phosphodiesterase